MFTLSGSLELAAHTGVLCGHDLSYFLFVVSLRRPSWLHTLEKRMVRDSHEFAS